MDFNDIKNRMERIYASLKERADYDLQKGILTEVSHTPSEVGIKVNFGTRSESEILNKIFIILYNIASLKDHLKNALKQTGKNENVVETTINSSPHLSVLIDLVNQEKHEYPLTKYIRSHKNPILRNVRESLRISTGKGSSGASFVLDPRTMMFKSEGDNAIVINADIFDDKNNKLFPLDELIEKSLEPLEEIVRKHL